MTSNASFTRKVAYIVAMAVLLIPLSVMSRPATVKKQADHYDFQPGGTLAQMRSDAGLSQAQLGEIDPASETMKLATFGMRGVAVVLLWDRAQEYKKKQDWDNLSATLEQIARLQPNFVTVWEHQAHNLSYNVSIEFDDYKQRYNWVKKGIDYLIEGTRYNRKDPRLLWYAGWVIGQKIGRADERVQFRRLFRDDQEFHDLLKREQLGDFDRARGVDGKPDNWLVGRLWYLKAIDAHREGRSIGGKSPVLFYSSPIMSRCNFAGDLEKEPGFDEERVRSEWGQAYDEWKVLGDLPLPSSAGYDIRLNEADTLEAQIKELEEKLDELLPGVREKLREEKRANLPADVRRALEKPAEDRTASDRSKVAQAEEALKVVAGEVADKAPSEKTVEARRLVMRIMAESERLRYTRMSRQISNFDFWRAKAASGATKLSTSARQHLYEAQRLFARPDLEGAKREFEMSFKEWAELFKQWPDIKDDADNSDLVDATKSYIKVLEQLDLRDEAGGILPSDFPLADLLRDLNEEALLRFRQPTADEEKPKDETPSNKDSAAAEKTSEESSDEKPAEDKPSDAKGSEASESKAESADADK